MIRATRCSFLEMDNKIYEFLLILVIIMVSWFIEVKKPAKIPQILYLVNGEFIASKYNRTY
jgi:hypothetical protein